MEFNEYQEAAEKTTQLKIDTEEGRVELVLGLACEVGAVSRVYKRFIRDKVSLDRQGDELIESLGDVLWYLTTIATSLKVRLDHIAQKNLIRINDRYLIVSDIAVPEHRADFDSTYPVMERFPRQMLFQLSETLDEENVPKVRFALLDAQPNPFPDGPVSRAGRRAIGFKLGEPIGNEVDDNSASDDGYRYHDAIHVAFMTVLGWSPVMRALLGVKRKSNAETDRVQDGARANNLEEGLSAILAEMSEKRNNYASESDIDSEVRDVIKKVIKNLEVGSIPIWKWAKAIHCGYQVMNELKDNNGGYILANLDRASVTFHSSRPALPSPTSES